MRDSGVRRTAIQQEINAIFERRARQNGGTTGDSDDAGIGGNADVDGVTASSSSDKTSAKKEKNEKIASRNGGRTDRKNSKKVNSAKGFLPSGETGR